jgi:hypothetical protein
MYLKSWYATYRECVIHNYPCAWDVSGNKTYIIHFSISVKSWRQSLGTISQNHIDNIIDLRENNLREIYVTHDSYLINKVHQYLWRFEA